MEVLVISIKWLRVRGTASWRRGREETESLLKVSLYGHCGQWQGLQWMEGEWARATVQQREEVPRDPRMVAAGPSSGVEGSGGRGVLVGAESLEIVKRTKDV